jgi:hypothetical protein
MQEAETRSAIQYLFWQFPGLRLPVLGRSRMATRAAEILKEMVLFWENDGDGCETVLEKCRCTACMCTIC